MNPLEELVGEVVGPAAAVEVHEEKIQSDVYRLRCVFDGVTRSFVGKRLDPDVARRTELVARRWLPARGLADSGPPLLAAAAERDGSAVWHLYEDLGECDLDVQDTDHDCLVLAVAAIARIHVAFARHTLTPEFRIWGGDRGIYFYAASVRDAIVALESVLACKHRLAAERQALCDRLLVRLAGLADEEDIRAQALARHGGPETLLHGDLTRRNVMVHANGTELRVRLIDWDHAGVGPVSYDLSTFLHRFPESERPAILRLYEDQVAGAGWRLPAPAELNVLFETAELGRIANRVIWPALAACRDGADWAYAELREVERWFEQLEPILPAGEACAQL